MESAISRFRKKYFSIKKELLDDVDNESIKDTLEVYFENLERMLISNNVVRIIKNLRSIIDSYAPKPAPDIAQRYAERKHFFDEVLKELDVERKREEDKRPLVFISHSAAENDSEYANMLCRFIVGLGVDRLVYTSNANYGVSFGKNVYDYLRESLNGDIFMIILWSNSYLESTACLCELGATWVKQCGYANIYTPDFKHGEPKYLKSPADPYKMGAVLKGDENCKILLWQLITSEFLGKFSLDERKSYAMLNIFCKNLLAFNNDRENYNEIEYKYNPPTPTVEQKGVISPYAHIKQNVVFDTPSEGFVMASATDKSHTHEYIDRFADCLESV